MPTVFDGSKMSKKLSKKTERLSGYERAKDPPGIEITDRDREIFLTIYRYDGVLSADQVHRWFFGAKRRAQYRISALFHNRYLQRSTPELTREHRIPEPIVWLDRKGAESVAEQFGIEEIKDLSWRRTPRWSRISHDIGLNEARRIIENAANTIPSCSIEVWHGQDDLQRMFPDKVRYLDRDNQVKEKGVWSDAYLRLRVRQLSSREVPIPFLIEFDNGTFDQPRLAEEKLSPIMHLILSKTYRRQLGEGGRLLVIAKASEVRFQNMRKNFTRFGGSPFSLFVRASELTVEQAITEPVWLVPHCDQRVSLVEYASPDFQKWLARTTEDLPRMSFLKQ